MIAMKLIKKLFVLVVAALLVACGQEEKVAGHLCDFTCRETKSRIDRPARIYGQPVASQSGKSGRGGSRMDSGNQERTAGCDGTCTSYPASRRASDAARTGCNPVVAFCGRPQDVRRAGKVRAADAFWSFGSAIRSITSHTG